jgi:ABC-type uncharacterized transport system permease subunit
MRPSDSRKGNVLRHIRIGLETFLFGVYGVRYTFSREFIPNLVDSVATTGVNVAIYGFMSFIIGFNAPYYFQYFLVSFILSKIADVGRHTISSIQSYGRKISSWIFPMNLGNGFLYIFYTLSYEYQTALSILTALLLAGFFSAIPEVPLSSAYAIISGVFAYASLSALMQAVAELIGVRVRSRRIFFITVYQSFNSLMAGVFFPVSLFPEPIRTIASIYPITIALGVARNAVLLGISDPATAAGLVIVGIVALLLTKKVLDRIWEEIAEHDLWTYYIRYV